MSFHLFATPFSSMIPVLFFHRFWDGFWYHFWCFCWYLSRSHMQPSKPSKTFVFTMNFNVFTIQRNMIVDDFPDLFRYQFWHWFLMTFGIDFGSILGPLWHQIPCFLVIVFLMNCWIDLLSIVDQKCVRKSICVRRCTLLFRIIFPNTCTFHLRKTYKCQKLCFPNFLKQKNINTCTFYKRETYKCGMTVFTLLKK